MNQVKQMQKHEKQSDVWYYRKCNGMSSVSTPWSTNIGSAVKKTANKETKKESHDLLATVKQVAHFFFNDSLISDLRANHYSRPELLTTWTGHKPRNIFEELPSQN